MRAWISAELDGELSDFESILLRGHLVGCDSCRTFKYDAAAFAGAVPRVDEPANRRLASKKARPPAASCPGVAALAALMIASGGLFTSLNSGAIFPKAKTGSVESSTTRTCTSFSVQNGRARPAASETGAMAAAVQIPRSTGFQNP